MRKRDFNKIKKYIFYDKMIAMREWGESESCKREKYAKSEEIFML